MRHFDLTAAARRILGKANGLINQCAGCESAIIDLNQAIGCLDAIEDIRNHQGRPPAQGLEVGDRNGLIFYGLHTAALINYVRTTHTSSTRGTIALAQHLKGEELRYHNALCELRNNGLAHFGRARHGGRTWNKEAFVFSLRDDGVARIALASERHDFQEESFRSLYWLCHRAKAIYFDMLHKKQDLLFPLLEDEGTARIVMATPFDIRAFFSADQGAADFENWGRKELRRSTRRAVDGRPPEADGSNSAR